MKPVIEDLYFYDYINYDGKKYFANASFNALYKMNSNYKCEFISKFPTEKYNAKDLFQSIVTFDKEVFFIPSGGKSVVIYSLADNDFESICFNNQQEVCYVQAIDILEEAFLIPLDLSIPFALLNMKNKEIKIINEINEGIRKNIGNEIKFSTAYPAIYYKHNVYVVLADTNMVIRIRWGEWSVSVYTLQNDVHVKSINEINGQAYITCKEGVIIQWDFENRESVWKTPPVDERSSFPYLRLIYVNNEYLLIPGHENSIWKTTQKNSEWEKLNTPREFERKIDKLLFYSYEIFHDNTVALYPRSGNGILTYCTDNDTFDFIPMKPGDKEVEMIEREWAKDMTKDAIIDEGTLELSDFIFAVEKLN